MNLPAQPQNIDFCDTLFLFSIAEQDQNTLSIVLDEGVTSPISQDLSVSGGVFSNVHAVEVVATSRRFEFYWDSYISYAVRNESYASCKEWEESIGKKFRIYSKSVFLEYVASATLAKQDFPGPFIHYSIICANHIIDVVSQDPPTVRLAQRV
jgi:hypothetical protein